MKKSYFKTGVMLIMLVVFAGVLVSANAQDDAAAAAPAAEENVQETTFIDLLKQGGPFMWPLGLFSVATLFFIIRNSMLLRQKTLLRADLQAQIQEKMAEKDVDGVRDICKNNPSLMTSVLDAGLERISDGDSDSSHVSEAIEEAGNEQMVTFMKPINYLSIIGGTSPMLGLLGTVSGMIKAFQNISAGGMGKPEVLAGNIGEALMTTATGLVIAIPAMISYFIFKNNFIKHMSTMGRMVSQFMSVYRNAQK